MNYLHCTSRIVTTSAMWSTVCLESYCCQGYSDPYETGKYSRNWKSAVVNNFTKYIEDNLTELMISTTKSRQRESGMIFIVENLQLVILRAKLQTDDRWFYCVVCGRFGTCLRNGFFFQADHSVRYEMLQLSFYLKMFTII